MSITLFENITDALTDLEKDKLVPMLKDTLSNTHTENRFRGKTISSYYKACGYPVSEARIRKMVNYLRVTNSFGNRVLIGASNGYYLTSDVRCIDDQIESLEGRIDAMQCVVDALKSQRLSLKRAV